MYDTVYLGESDSSLCKTPPVVTSAEQTLVRILIWARLSFDFRTVHFFINTTDTTPSLEAQEIKYGGQ